MGIKSQKREFIKVKKTGKKSNIKVYMTEMYLDKIKVKAKNMGINYKAMMVDILHKYANGLLREKA